MGSARSEMKFLGGWTNHLILLILGVFICMNGVDFNLLPALCIGDTNYMGTIAQCVVGLGG